MANMQNIDRMSSSVGIPGRKRAVKPQAGTSPKAIVCELGVGKTLYLRPCLRQIQTPFWWGRLPQNQIPCLRAKRPKTIQRNAVSVLCCIKVILYPRVISTKTTTWHVHWPRTSDHMRKEQFLTPDSQLREKWSSLSKPNSPAVNGAKCCVRVLNNKLTRSRQGFQLRIATFGNLRKLSEPLRESSATNVWTLVL